MLWMVIGLVIGMSNHHYQALKPWLEKYINRKTFTLSHKYGRLDLTALTDGMFLGMPGFTCKVSITISISHIETKAFQELTHINHLHVKG